MSAFAIDQATGALAPLNAWPTNGTYPAHLGVHPSGQYLLASSYGTGSCSVYAIQADGSIGPMTEVDIEFGPPA